MPVPIVRQGAGCETLSWSRCSGAELKTKDLRVLHTTFKALACEFCTNMAPKKCDILIGNVSHISDSAQSQHLMWAQPGGLGETGKTHAPIIFPKRVAY